jgi:HSP20 family protein
MARRQSAREEDMAKSQELSVQQKKELTTKEEKTVPARYYVPATDIHETENALVLVMEIPGVEKKDVSVKLENDVLHVEGRIDFSKYDGLEPVHAEYNIGHFARGFTLSDRIDQDGISAELAEGVLTLTLKKAASAQPRRIEIR